MPNAQAMTAPLPAGLASIIQQANPVDEISMAVAKCGAVVRMAAFGGACAGDMAGAITEYGGGYGYRGGEGSYGYGGGYRTRNGCPPNYTIQDGVSNHTVATERSSEAAAVIAAASFSSSLGKAEFKAHASLPLPSGS